MSSARHGVIQMLPDRAERANPPQRHKDTKKEERNHNDIANTLSHAKFASDPYSSTKTSTRSLTLVCVGPLNSRSPVARKNG